MCGRFTLTSPADALRQLFDLSEIAAEVLPRFNIAPTQLVAVVPNRPQRRLELFRWGLIPRWAKDASVGNRMINARAETVATKASFKESLASRRCLVLADGFYEWRKPQPAQQGSLFGDAPPAGRRQPKNAPKIPMYVRLRTREPFAFAGLWQTWHAPDGTVVPSCTIITTEPNSLMRPIHDRMPVILPQQALPLWLDPAPRPAAQLCPLLKPFAAELMEAHRVGFLVNNPANEDPRCINPVDENREPSQE